MSQVIGIDTLSDCKGAFVFFCALSHFLCLRPFKHTTHSRINTEPGKQFALVVRHIERIRQVPMLQFSEIVVMCERNLGFEAEHHERALRGIAKTRHRIDHAAKRFGVLTTQEIKHAMCTLTSTMMREQRVNILKPLLSENPAGNAKRLNEQLTIYSLQFKEAANVFGKGRAALSGKVGGMKDDVVIAMQLGIYFSKEEYLYR
jgi:16S rRNA G1207 methylase RsmC